MTGLQDVREGGTVAAAPAAELGRPGRILSVTVGGMILVMMVLTAIDVAGRYFLNAPLFGAFEMTEILMGLVVFAGMPLTTAAREHIVVNFLENVLSARVRLIQAAIGDAVSAVVTGIMTWRIFVRGQGLIEVGETTLLLGVGRGYIAIAMAVLLGVTTLVFLYAAVLALRAART